MFSTVSGTWNATNEGSHDSPLSILDVIRHDFEGTTTPSELSNYFLFVGHDCSTSEVDMVDGD